MKKIEIKCQTAQRELKGGYMEQTALPPEVFIDGNRADFVAAIEALYKNQVELDKRLTEMSRSIK